MDEIHLECLDDLYVGPIMEFQKIITVIEDPESGFMPCRLCIKIFKARLGVRPTTCI